MDNTQIKMKKQKTGIARLLQIAGRRRLLLLLSGVLALLHALLTMVPYVLIFYILDKLLTGGVNNSDIHDYLYWGFWAMLVSFLLMYASAMASHVAAFNILYELRCKIAAKLGKLPMGYLNNRSSGELKKILADDIERIELFIAHGIPDFVKGLTLPVIILSYLFAVDWKLALISFIPLLIAGLVVPVTFFGDKNKQLMNKYHSSLEDMNSGIVEFVRAMPVMKIFGQTATAFRRYSESVSTFHVFVNKWTKRSTPAWSAFVTIINNAAIPVLAVGLYLYFEKGMNLSVLFLFLILGVGYIKPLFALVGLGPQISIINYGVKRIDDILFNVKEQTNGEVVFPADTELEFDNVSFSYSKGVEVLRNVSFKVAPNTITALVGPSGSGKSTIGQLTARFWDVDRGAVRIGGVNIKALNYEELMANVSFVFQDNMMFYQSIKDNILMGADKTDEEVVNAAKIARCHDFIMKLPNGYDTHYGAKGVHLSGGEQQRIQLARIVLKDAPIVVLDEATAFSDPENEYMIMQACKDIIKDKTVVIIAHRLSTIVNADNIIVLDEGTVKGSGRHSDLLNDCPLYAKMWNAHIRAKDFAIDSEN